MRPYIVKGITLIFYNGQREDLVILETRIMDEPLRNLKERILDGFSKCAEPPVNAEIKVKYL